MKTFRRICIEDHVIEDELGQRLELKRGSEYLTSHIKDGKVCVFGPFWEWVPAELFAGEVQFT